MNTNDNNIYKLGYNILVSAFDEKNLDLGVLNALQLIQQSFQCKEVSIYKIDKNSIINKYSYPNDDFDFIINFFKKNIKMLEQNTDYDIQLNDNKFNRLTWLFIDNQYLLVLINGKFKDNIINYKNNIILKKALMVILKKEIMIDKLIKSSNIDGLTSLENRLAFNKKVEEYNNNKNHVIFVMLDLFRLKYINDNFGHIAGDLYIKGASDILKQYFPKYKYNCLTKDNIYRIGGDEFVIISENKTIQEIKYLLEIVKDKIKNLDLGIKENISIGINYGIAERTNNETIEQLYVLSDNKLSEDKKTMYEELKINRRK